LRQNFARGNWRALGFQPTSAAVHPCAVVLVFAALQPAEDSLVARDPDRGKRAQKQDRFVPLELHDDPGWDTGQDRYQVGPGLRLSPGLSLGVAETETAAFVFDAALTARLGLTPGEYQWVLVPEAGWSYNGAGSRQFLTAGVGIGRGSGETRPSSEARAIFGGFSYVPRFVLGVGDAFPTKGVRHGILWDHGETTFSIEGAHEVLWNEDGSVSHAIRAQLSIDVGRMFWLFAGR
jgi:hypothetical protein